MRCPYCGHDDQRVLDSRPARDGGAVRRRRECFGCGRRFTTFEEPERPRLFVVKRGGAREPFDREKLFQSLLVACRRRPVTLDRLREAAERVERGLLDLCRPEVPSRAVGDRAMAELFAIDPVAFVRFASVYREFSDLDEFTRLVGRVQSALARAATMERAPSVADAPGACPSRAELASTPTRRHTLP